MDNNKCSVVGTVTRELVFDHKYADENFFSTDLSVQRRNPQHCDIIPVIISELLIPKHMHVGQKIMISGEFRSRNEEYDGKTKLRLYLFVQEIDEVQIDKNINRIVLDGFICKQPVKRTTPLGSKICEVILAVNRQYAKTDYIPCIAWGRVADMIAEMDVGSELKIDGRVQSREYTKDGMIRTAYEVSIMTAKKIVKEKSESI